MRPAALTIIGTPSASEIGRCGPNFVALIPLISPISCRAMIFSLSATLFRSVKAAAEANCSPAKLNAMAAAADNVTSLNDFFIRVHLRV
ncbi:hypothetical protein D3C73_1573370 [compost metagenome]